MSMKLAAAAAVVAAVVIVSGAGAYLLASDHDAGGIGTVSIYVKDAPSDWKHINVTFSVVTVHKKKEDKESGWYTLSLEAQTIDLVSLTNLSELLASGNVSAGKYTQIRIVITSVTGTKADGEIVNFTVPSGELKTTHPFNVTEDHTEALTLDFDLEHSIVQAGSGWKFKPVLGAIIEG